MLIAPVQTWRMFGGAGVYREEVFFGLDIYDTLFFKVDELNKAEYEEASSGPFNPFGSCAMSYYEVPANVLEDQDELILWARRAVEVARNEIRNKAVTRNSKKAGKE